MSFTHLLNSLSGPGFIIGIIGAAGSLHYRRILVKREDTQDPLNADTQKYNEKHVLMRKVYWVMAILSSISMTTLIVVNVIIPHLN